MQLYEQDKAIEFKALYNDVRRIITNYQNIGLDVSEEVPELARIYQQYNNSLPTGATQVQAEVQYNEGMSELMGLKASVEEKYQMYYAAYQNASNIEIEMGKKDYSKERVRVFAVATTALLNQIEKSDTRDYAKEEVVVNKIYSLAYNVIKLEMIVNGKSEVLEKIKGNPTASSFINELIESDLVQIEAQGIENDIIRRTVSALASQKTYHSYLDEGLILFIAMQKKGSIKLVEDTLLDLIKEMTNSNLQLEATKSNNSILEDKINEFKGSIKGSKIYRNLVLAASLLGLLASLKYGSEKFAKTIGHKEYKTYVDFYSTSSDAQAPVYPEYMEKIDGFGKTTLIAQDVWQQESIFYGDYHRDIVTYDLSGIDVDALEDFMDYDFSKVKASNKETETREEVSASELYDKAIVEITRLTQNENNSIFVPDEENQELFLVIVSTIGAILGSIAGIGILLSTIHELKNCHNAIMLKRESIKEWEEGLESYKQLCAENEEFSNRFVKMYQQFSKFIKNPEIKEQYQRILTKRKEENEVNNV